MNPFSRALAVVTAVLALAAAFFFGLIVLALAVGFGLLFWLVFRIRMWWIRRHLPPIEAKPETRQNQDEVIEAEYTVISRRSD
jgi:type IV secretory pathway TrbD component